MQKALENKLTNAGAYGIINPMVNALENAKESGV